MIRRAITGTRSKWQCAFAFEETPSPIKLANSLAGGLMYVSDKNAALTTARHFCCMVTV